MIAGATRFDLTGRHTRSYLRRISLLAMLAVSTAVVASCSDDPTEPEEEEVLAALEVSAPASVMEGAPFTITVTAVGDQGTSPFTGFSGAVSLAATGRFGTGTLDPSTVQVVNGTGTSR